MIWSISWKNIWRNKIRSSIVIVAVSLGIFGGVFSTAVMIGAIDQRIREAIGNEVSHVQIHNKQYLDNNELKYSINNSRSIIDSIKTLENVKAVSGRVKTFAMANTSGSASGVMINAVDPETEKSVSTIYKQIKNGGDYLDADNKKPIVIGERLAKELRLVTYEIDNEVINTLKEDPRFDETIPGLESLLNKKYRKVEDFENDLIEVLGEETYKEYEYPIKGTSIKYKLRKKIVLSFQTNAGNISYDAYRVCGVYKTNNSAFDALNVFVRKADILRVLGLNESDVHEIAVLVDENGQEDEVAKNIQSMIHEEDLSIQTWSELLPDVGLYNDYMDVMLMLVLSILLLAMGFGIVNTMLMAVLERVKELGMLMAIGMNRKKVFSMIMLETILLCMVGAVVGMIVSYGLIIYSGKYGIDLTAGYQAGLEVWGFSAMLYPKIGWDSFLQVTILVIITGILASIYPARKALKLNPSEALRVDM